LVEDECDWFVRSVDEGVVQFRDCPPDCFRAKKWGSVGPDHFLTPAGKPRHLFSKPDSEVAWLNREYIPHIAAYARLVLDLGYDRRSTAFSLYRTFANNLITKRAGQSYETDVELYAPDGSVWLQVEAKASASQTAALARGILDHCDLTSMPTRVAKEIEYVLDLRPRHLWVVGPGTVDPAAYVFEVAFVGPTASFNQIGELPPPMEP
jgi:hypothetical protein